MSRTPVSTTEWLLSLPQELQGDIASSVPLLTPALLALHASIGDSTNPLDDPASTIASHSSSLLTLLSALEGCPLSLTWSSSITRNDEDCIFHDINTLRVWLIVDRKRYPKSPNALSCCRLVLSAQQHTTAAHLWQTLFAIFCPPPAAIGNIIQSTPLRVSSGNRVNIGTTHSAVDPALQHELHQLIYINTDKFFETYFPAQPAAFDLCRDFLRDEDETWRDWPAEAIQDDVIDWFREVTTAILDSSTPRIDRNYYSSADRAVTGTTAVRKKDLLLYPTTKGRRFPKGNRGNNWTFDVSNVLVVGELKKSLDVDATRGLIVQLAGYVRLMFYHQQNRRFVHAFTLTGDWMRCYIFHRGGGFASERFSINDEPRRFVDVVFGYATMTPGQLGYDTTLVFDQYKFKMDDCKGWYLISKTAIFNRPVIASRGTTCWDVVKKGDKARPKSQLILKDAWRNTLYESEANYFKQAIAANVKGLVQVVAMEEVVFEGKRDEICQNIMKGLIVSGRPLELVAVHVPEVIDHPGFDWRQNIIKGTVEAETTSTVETTSVAETTSIAETGTADVTDSTLAQVTPPPSRSLRSQNKRELDVSDAGPPAKRSRGSSVPPPPVFNRVHTRILMHKGQSLLLFTTPRDLLLGLHDAIIGHRSLLQDAGILHRDISIHNIMLTPSTHPRPDGLRGFLIDLDMATKINSPPSGALHRTGTVEFMAIEVLLGGVHTYRHDLESFWYVFIWLCVFRNTKYNTRITPLHRWSASDLTDVGRNKRENIVRGEAFGYQSIEAAFAPECRCFLQVADQWRKFMFPLQGVGEATVKLDAWVDVDAAYDGVLAILKEAAEKV